MTGSHPWSEVHGRGQARSARREISTTGLARAGVQPKGPSMALRNAVQPHSKLVPIVHPSASGDRCFRVSLCRSRLNDRDNNQTGRGRSSQGATISCSHASHGQ